MSLGARWRLTRCDARRGVYVQTKAEVVRAVEGNVSNAGLTDSFENGSAAPHRQQLGGHDAHGECDDYHLAKQRGRRRQTCYQREVMNYLVGLVVGCVPRLSLLQALSPAPVAHLAAQPEVTAAMRDNEFSLQDAHTLCAAVTKWEYYKSKTTETTEVQDKGDTSVCSTVCSKACDRTRGMVVFCFPLWRGINRRFLSKKNNTLLYFTLCFSSPFYGGMALHAMFFSLLFVLFFRFSFFVFCKFYFSR